MILSYAAKGEVEAKYAASGAWIELHRVAYPGSWGFSQKTRIAPEFLYQSALRFADEFFAHPEIRPVPASGANIVVNPYEKPELTAVMAPFLEALRTHPIGRRCRFGLYGEVVRNSGTAPCVGAYAVDSTAGWKGVADQKKAEWQKTNEPLAWILHHVQIVCPSCYITKGDWEWCESTKRGSGVEFCRLTVRLMIQEARRLAAARGLTLGVVPVIGPFFQNSNGGIDSPLPAPEMTAMLDECLEQNVEEAVVWSHDTPLAIVQSGVDAAIAWARGRKF